MTKPNTAGRIQVYTGDGKGKTTCALGAGLRAAGHGLDVLVISFMKAKVAWRGDGDGDDVNYGEFRAVEKIPNFSIIPMGRESWVDKENPDPVDIQMAQDALSLAHDALREHRCDVLILDEINVAVEWNLISIEQQMELISSLPSGIELIMTGRYAREEIIHAADLVTEMKEIKHYFTTEKAEARKGFEF